ncbi:hypothetical protein M2302_001943 [Micromonospora sp. A200]|uniref:hypothetical protein n=1 Tax=Micromonospora sp. A200 TaxID=2940568 RepID=UPI002474529D|nr:hypothetical protein [Micromonospora sp. A200]MDH6461768.1 hypothetical protein [Micromonospora sp. A200]
MAGKQRTSTVAKTWEVLTENPVGRRTVVRITGPDADTVRAAVAKGLPHGHQVLDVAAPGEGLGSRDRDSDSR